MGLLLSVVISYAGINEALECIRHIMSGMLPETDPDFRDLVEYYTMLLHKRDQMSNSADWSQYGQGYLSLTEDQDGLLKSATIKYHDGQPDSTAILFSTKISSFGQDSVEEHSQSHANGDFKTERYTPTRTKTIISNTSESISVGNKKPTTTYENISDPTPFSESSFEHDENNDEDTDENKEKLTWHYRPRSPIPKTLPEIHFQSSEGEKKGDQVYSEDFLRSLDGIKYRPLQRSDPSGRRRSFKKRHSSSSTSSKESRASREEELKMFTSLEEAEFERMTSDKNDANFGSTPNLSARSYSRSRSRENSKERRNENWSVDASVDSLPDDDRSELKPRLKDLPVLDSFEEEHEEKQTNEVTQEDEGDDDDFWGNSGD